MQHFKHWGPLDKKCCKSAHVHALGHYVPFIYLLIVEVIILRYCGCFEHLLLLHGGETFQPLVALNESLTDCCLSVLASCRAQSDFLSCIFVYLLLV